MINAVPGESAEWNPGPKVAAVKDWPTPTMLKRSTSILKAFANSIKVFLRFFLVLFGRRTSTMTLTKRMFPWHGTSNNRQGFFDANQGGKAVPPVQNILLKGLWPWTPYLRSPWMWRLMFCHTWHTLSEASSAVLEFRSCVLLAHWLRAIWQLDAIDHRHAFWESKPPLVAKTWGRAQFKAE